MKMVTAKQLIPSYPVAEWEAYARLFASVTTSVQLALYREACLHLQGHVIDCGCGSAKIAPLLADNEQVSAYTGVDYAAEMVAIAQWIVQTQQRESFTIQHSKIEEVEDSFNSGVSIQSYYSWPNPIATLSHIFNILTAGEIFVLATPNHHLSMEKLIKTTEQELIGHPDLAAYRDYNLQLANNPQANFISMNNLIKQVQQVGFEIMECHQKHFQGGINFLVLYKKC